MAHKPNFNMTDYSKIWKNVYQDINQTDLAFANLESPVVNELDYSSFPNFNMHSEYPEEAINTGFNCFSIVNNHSNDQGLDGIKHTYSWKKNIQEKYKKNGMELYFSGIKNSPESDFSYELIEKNGWKILFVAATEILNRPSYAKWLNYYPYTEDGRSHFAEYCFRLREENPCDLFIVSLHTDEPEYVAPVAKKRKEYYRTLLASGVDVLWTNHPHIIRERELYGNKQSGQLKKIIFYGNGNTISGQRWEPDPEKPDTPRDNTGDGLLYFATFTKNNSPKQPKNVMIKESYPVYITTYINSNWEFVLHKLDDSFINYLKENRKTWKNYFITRKNICENTKETIIWE